MLERAFVDAIATQGVVTGTAAYVKAMVQFDRTRGWAPAEVIHSLFPDDEIRAQAANLAFERSFQAAVDRFGALPLPGANDALAKLAAAGVKVCLMSCLSRPALSLVMERLAWWQRGDLILCGDDVARGFPWPDLVLTAILLGVGDVRDVAVVTSGESGVLAARLGPGARLAIGVLSDVHDGRRAFAGPVLLPAHRPRRTARPDRPQPATPPADRGKSLARPWQTGGMPELPEVESLAAFLREHAVGHTVARADAASFSVLKTSIPRSRR